MSSGTVCPVCQGFIAPVGVPYSYAGRYCHCTTGGRLQSIQSTMMMPCNCIGPQPGFPRCPCQMRGVVKRDGRWIQLEQDLGAAP